MDKGIELGKVCQVFQAFTITCKSGTNLKSTRLLTHLCAGCLWKEGVHSAKLADRLTDMTGEEDAIQTLSHSHGCLNS